MKVLLAIDGSAHSDAAAAEVAARSWPEDTSIEVLTVVHSSVPMLPDPAFVIAAIRVEDTQEQWRRAPEIAAAARDLIRRGTKEISVTTKVLEGLPKDMIVDEARDWGADLIILGSHGYGPVKRFVLGSVAAAVVASAPCSVLVVRPKGVVSAA